MIISAMFKSKKIKVNKVKLEQAQKVFDRYGLSAEEVMDSFLNYVVIENEIPFSVDKVTQDAKHEGSFLNSIIRILFAQCEYIYYINLNNNQYREYVAGDGYVVAGPNRVGDDFFRDTYTSIDIIIHEDDRAMMKKALTKDNILSKLADGGIFSITYRMIITGSPVYYNLRASFCTEDSSYILIEVRNINKQYEQEDEYKRRIAKASEEARTDILTGCLNYLAYEEYKEVLNKKIANKERDFAFVMCDLNSLKEVNDSLGHFIGDQYLIEATEMMRHFFQNSKIFRVGGDEFIISVEGEDFPKARDIVDAFKKESFNNIDKDRPVISIGLAEVSDDITNVDDLYRVADREMYKNKREFKERRW